MSAEMIGLFFVATSQIATVILVVFRVGRWHGQNETRLENIEGNLKEIRGVLMRAGVSFRNHDEDP